MYSELDRIKFIENRDGKIAAKEFAKRTIRNHNQCKSI